MTTEAGIGVMLPGAQECSQPVEVEEGPYFPLEPPGRTRPADTLILALEGLFWTSDFQNCKIINLSGFKADITLIPNLECFLLSPLCLKCFFFAF